MNEIKEEVEWKRNKLDEKQMEKEILFHDVFFLWEEQNHH